MVLIPLLGMWLLSSLAAYHNRSIAACIGFGLLLFPVLPLLWDRFYLWRSARKDPERKKKRILAGVDRIVIRTLALNLSFVIGILAIAKCCVNTSSSWPIVSRVAGNKPVTVMAKAM
jgi:hypothetical protein